MKQNIFLKNNNLSICQKVTFGIMIILISVIFLTVEAETISDQTLESLILWADGKLDGKSTISILHEFEKNNLISLKSNISQTYFLPKKGQVEFVRISGNTMDYQKRAPVFLTIISPEGSRENITLQTLETGVYFTNYVLSDESKLGLYSITGTYQGAPIPTSFFVVKHSADVIPSWFGKIVMWVNDKKISESEFISSLQYLIDHDVIQISSSKNESIMQVKVTGEKLIRRGTTQEIIISVNDGINPIEGAKVFVTVEDLGENTLKEFTGISDSSGRYAISWEVPKNAEQERLLTVIDVTDGIHSRSVLFSFDVWCLCGEANCKCRN